VSILAEIEKRAAVSLLQCVGIAAVRTEDGLREDIRTVVLLGPREPEFWLHFQQTPESCDGAPDPLDRWSRRVIGGIACDLGAKAVFPFGGPPYRPFLAWALRSGQCWTSPVGLLVHEMAGLFISFRGAIALTEVIDARAAVQPCLTCQAQPCRTACPVGALTPGGYDVPRCHAYLEMEPGQICMTQGCAVRRACPVGQASRVAAQSAFHMRAFHPL